MPGALDVVMKVLGPDSQLEEGKKMERIVDMTIAYPEGKPLDLQSIVLGWRKPCNTHVHYRSWDVKVSEIFIIQQQIPISTIPGTPENLWRTVQLDGESVPTEGADAWWVLQDW